MLIVDFGAAVAADGRQDMEEVAAGSGDCDEDVGRALGNDDVDADDETGGRITEEECDSVREGNALPAPGAGVPGGEVNGDMANDDE